MNYNWDWGVFFRSTGIGEETYLDWFVAGLGWTIAVALAGWIIALLLGTLLGILRTVPNRWLAGIATCYVEIFRNVPLLVQLFLWYTSWCPTCCPSRWSSGSSRTCRRPPLPTCR